jgi:hypothetical protein
MAPELDPRVQALSVDPKLAEAFAAMLANQRDCLEVFRDRDFKGVSQKFATHPSGTASYDMSDLTAAGGVGNDTISSLKMPNTGGQGYGFTVTLYAGAGFTGASKSFRGDADYVGDDINDQTSSIRIMTMWP